MDKPYQAAPDIHVLPAHFQIPGAGFLPINAFVIMGKEPILIDTGMGIDREEFMKALRSIIDPRDLKWVWLTHDDADHTGSLEKVLEAAPNARVAACSLAILRMSTAWPVPMDRVYCLNPGDSIYAGDRKLTAVRPPLFDNPTSIGLYDHKSGAFFSADFFGAIIPAPARNADEVPEGDLSKGMVSWGSLDCPWVHMVSANEFAGTLESIRQLAPKRIFSAHLPPATGKIEKFLGWLETVPASTPSIAPDQAGLEQMLAMMRLGG